MDQEKSTIQHQQHHIHHNEESLISKRDLSAAAVSIHHNDCSNGETQSCSCVTVNMNQPKFFNICQCHFPTSSSMTMTAAAGMKCCQHFCKTRKKRTKQTSWTISSSWTLFTQSKMLHLFLLLFLMLSLSINLAHGQPPPPPPPAGFLDFDNLPVTRFSCEGKVIGGYYADVETGCQMFHVCTLGQKDEVQDIKFLCLNGTVFDQETRVCERVDEVDCSQAEKFYDLNLDLYVPHATTSSTTPIPTTTTTTTTTTLRTTQIPITSPKSSSTHLHQQHQSKSSSFANSFNRNSNTYKGSNAASAAPASASPREGPDERDNNNNADTQNDKGFSTYAYFHRTPHSVISSGYNSQLRQSYLINHQQGNNNNNPNNNTPASSTAPIVVETRTSSTSHGQSPTGRKVTPSVGASSAKTIVYTSTKPSVVQSSRHQQQQQQQQQIVSSTTPKQQQQQQQYHHQSSSTVKSVVPQSITHEIVDPNSASLQIEYPEDDEYYDEAEDYAALVAGAGGGGGGTGPSAPDAATILQNNHNQNTKIELSDRSSVNRVSKNISPATAFNLNHHQQQQQQQQAATKPTQISLLHHHQQQQHIINDNSTEEPYYYEDEYEDHVQLQPQQQQQQSQPQSQHHQQTQSVSSRTAPAAPAPAAISISSSSSSAGVDTDSPEYYDENDESGLDVNSHHFSHVDVPRIPYAKPNVPRVLVTNGKPFLPRLRRQSFYTHHLEPGSSLWNYYLNTVNTFNQSSSSNNNNRDSNLPSR